jgi:hypothetical protein
MQLGPSPDRPPRCCGTFKNLYGFWSLSLWRDLSLLSLTVFMIYCSMPFQLYAEKKRCGFYCILLLPLLLIFGTVTALLILFIVDLPIAFVWVVTCGACCGKRTSCRAHGDCYSWHSYGRDPIQYLDKNGSITNSSAFIHI